MKKLNQKGIAHLGLIILVVLLVIIGAVGWRVWDNSKEVSQSTTDTIVYKIKAQDSAKTIAYEYPSNWEIDDYEWEACCHGESNEEPDWSKTPQPITLRPIGAHKDVAAIIYINNNGLSHGKDLADTFDGAWKNRTLDQFNTHEKTKINDHDVLYTKTDFIGPANVEKWLRHTYQFFNKSSSIEIEFHERYSHDWNNQEEDGKVNYDATEYLSGFNEIVNSIKFL